MTTTATSPAVRGRLASLDILRGFDLFMLVFLQPVLVAVGAAVDAQWYNMLLYQLDHEVWEGFRAWDLVMPLFLFMVGAALPFSLARYIDGRCERRKAYTRIMRRFLLLFLLGMVVQGNLLALDPGAITIYTNTLQAIAVGYLVSAVVLLNCGLRGRLAVTVALLVIYWIPMHLCGDYTLEGSWAYAVDAAVIGPFRGDTTYTWIWSSLTFSATVMIGALAGELMKNDRRLTRPRIAAILAASGAALIAAGLLWSVEMPIIKRIWTSSMTLYAGGLSLLLMAAAYWWIDCLGHSRGLGWLKVYGMNAITAYILGEVVSFRSIVASLSYGLQHIIGTEWYAAWLTFGNFIILYLILLVMYRRGIFVKL